MILRTINQWEFSNLGCTPTVAQKKKKGLNQQGNHAITLNINVPVLTSGREGGDLVSRFC